MIFPKIAFLSALMVIITPFATPMNDKKIKEAPPTPGKKHRRQGTVYTTQEIELASKKNRPNDSYESQQDDATTWHKSPQKNTLDPYSTFCHEICRFTIPQKIQAIINNIETNIEQTELNLAVEDVEQALRMPYLSEDSIEATVNKITLNHSTAMDNYYECFYSQQTHESRNNNLLILSAEKIKRFVQELAIDCRLYKKETNPNNNNATITLYEKNASLENNLDSLKRNLLAQILNTIEENLTEALAQKHHYSIAAGNYYRQNPELCEYSNDNALKRYAEQKDSFPHHNQKALYEKCCEYDANKKYFIDTIFNKTLLFACSLRLTDKEITAYLNFCKKLTKKNITNAENTAIERCNYTTKKQYAHYFFYAKCFTLVLALLSIVIIKQTLEDISSSTSIGNLIEKNTPLQVLSIPCALLTLMTICKLRIDGMKNKIKKSSRSQAIPL